MPNNKRRGPFTPEVGNLDGSRKDAQSITSDWEFRQTLINGVHLREVRNVPKENGYLTELFRRDWGLAGGDVVDQVFQVTLIPGALSAWHVHRHTTDRLFVASALIKVVLYDARTASPTHGRVNEFRLGTVRPGLVIVPPGVWHGVQNIGEAVGSIINIVDRAYTYEDPDHWRLPPDTDRIPYRFTTRCGGSARAERLDGDEIRAHLT